MEQTESMMISKLFGTNGLALFAAPTRAAEAKLKSPRRCNENDHLFSTNTRAI
jgi:hypothetical protein